MLCEVPYTIRSIIPNLSLGQGPGQAGTPLILALLARMNDPGAARGKDSTAYVPLITARVAVVTTSTSFRLTSPLSSSIREISGWVRTTARPHFMRSFMSSILLIMLIEASPRWHKATAI